MQFSLVVFVVAFGAVHGSKEVTVEVECSKHDTLGGKETNVTNVEELALKFVKKYLIDCRHCPQHNNGSMVNRRDGISVEGVGLTIELQRLRNLPKQVLKVAEKEIVKNKDEESKYKKSVYSANLLNDRIDVLSEQTSNLNDPTGTAEAMAIYKTSEAALTEIVQEYFATNRKIEQSEGPKRFIGLICAFFTDAHESGLLEKIPGVRSTALEFVAGKVAEYGPQAVSRLKSWWRGGDGEKDVAVDDGDAEAADETNGDGKKDAAGVDGEKDVVDDETSTNANDPANQQQGQESTGDSEASTGDRDEGV